MQDEALDLREFLGTFGKWWWLFLAVPLLIGAITAAAGLASPVPAPKYTATATMLVEGGAASANYPNLIVTRPFLNDVINEAALPVSLDEIVGMVSAQWVPETQFLEVRATHEEPAMTRSVAHAVAASFVGYIDSTREEQFFAQREELARQMSAMGLFSTTTTIKNSMRDVIQQRMPEFARITLMIPAEVPNIPIVTDQRHIVRNTVLAAAVGVLLSIGVVMFLEYERAPIGSPSMFQRRFGISHLGTVPKWSKGGERTAELAVNGAYSTGESEAIKQVAANIGFAAKAKGIKSLCVTSPDLGEGRSSLIANLGYALSSNEDNVVLVDADLRRPSLHAYFKLENIKGLSDYLSNPEIEIEDVLRDTVYSGVKVITSGSQAPDPVALLRSTRMGALLKRLESEYQMVLVDTPPMVSLADGAVLAAQVGGSVMVVNASTTRLDAAVMALGNLEMAGAKMMGFIWDGVSSHSSSRYSRDQKHCRNQFRTGEHSPLAANVST